MALFLYHVVFGVQYLGILNGVAAFVIIGIGKSKNIHHFIHCIDFDILRIVVALYTSEEIEIKTTVILMNDPSFPPMIEIHNLCPETNKRPLFIPPDVCLAPTGVLPHSSGLLLRLNYFSVTGCT